MKINFSPVRMDEQLMVDREGDLLYVNGDVVDLSPLLEGASLPATAIQCKWFSDWVQRENGELELTLILPHGPTAAESTRFPQPIVVDYDGTVDIPPYDINLPETLEA